MKQNIISIIALFFSALALWFSYSQYSHDYDESLSVKVSGWPNLKISRNNKLALDISITNNSKRNTKYYLSVDGVGICAQEEKKLSLFNGCDYQSKTMFISNSGTPGSSKKHTIYLGISEGDVEQAVNKVNSEFKLYNQNIYIRISVNSIQNGKRLFYSKCYFEYSEKSLKLYQPVLDTTGQSKVIQNECGLYNKRRKI